jgi:hypothetical protein
MFYKSDGALAKGIIRRIKETYDIHLIKEVKWFLGVRVIKDRLARKL